KVGRTETSIPARIRFTWWPPRVEASTQRITRQSFLPECRISVRHSDITCSQSAAYLEGVSVQLRSWPHFEHLTGRSLILFQMHQLLHQHLHPPRTTHAQQ